MSRPMRPAVHSSTMGFSPIWGVLAQTGACCRISRRFDPSCALVKLMLVSLTSFDQLVKVVKSIRALKQMFFLSLCGKVCGNYVTCLVRLFFQKS